MKKKFTILIAAAVMLLTMMARPVTVWGQAPVNTVLWGETWGTFTSQVTPSNYNQSGTTVYNNVTVTYAQSNTNTKLYNENSAGGASAPELLLAKNNQTWTINGIPSGSATGLTLTFKANYDRTVVSSTTTGISIGEKSFSNKTVTYPITVDPTISTFSLVFTNTSGSNVRIDDIELVVTTAGGSTQTPTITLSETGELNIGNYAVNTELDSRTFTVSQSNLSEGITLTATNGGTLTPNSIDLDADPTEVTWNFTTPAEAGQFTSVITATSGETSASFTYLGYAYANHNVIIAEMEHGTVIADPTSTYYYQNVTLTVTPDEGYELGTLSVVDGNNNPVTVTNNSFHMPDSDVTVSATFVVATPTTTVTDILNREFTGINAGGGYSAWSNKEGTSGAIYAGKTAGGTTSNPSIQLRTSGSDCGIVTTATGGFVTKVTVTWNSATTTNNRALSIYGSNSEYSSAANLYNADTDGDYLGDITFKTNSSLCQTEYTISDNYAYIGLRSKDGAIYFDEIQITWSTEVPSVAKPTFSPAAGTYQSTQNVTIACETENTAIYYTTDGTEPTNESTQYTEPISVAQTTTIKAIAYDNDGNASSVATATYTIVTPLTSIPQIFAMATEVGSTQTDVYVTFNNWIVVGKSYSNAYVSDGQYGLNLYKSGGIDFAIGDQLSGTVATKVQLFTGGAELVGLTTSTVGLNVDHDHTFEPYEISLANLTGQGIYFGSYVDLGNLTYTSEDKFTDENDHVINPYNTFGITDYPTLEAGKTYRVKGVYIRYNNTTERIAPVYVTDFTEYVGPSIEATPSPFTAPSYVVGTTEPEFETLTVNGSNLTANISLSLGDNSNFEMSTDLDTWSSSLTLTQTDGSVTNAEVAIRLKAGLTKGDYNGTVTLSSTDAQNVVVNLSGSVTGQTYAINIDDEITGGTIAADLTTAEAGATVTLTATPDAAYNFGSWTVKDEGENPITVSDNQFVMPSSNVTVTATFTPKDTYAITCAVTPDGAALMEASPASAYEGQTITLSYAAETGYSLSSIVITKTSDGSATGITPTASGDDYTFTMPDYAVTATATFLSDTYTGSFVLFENAIEEGDYLIVLNDKAVLNTISSARLNSSDVAVSNGIISDPSRNIVWHIAPSATDGYWAIYNAKIGQYISNSKASDKDIALVNTTNYNSGAIWSIDGTTTYVFRSKYNQDSGNSARYLGQNGDYFASYTSSYDHNLTLYKYTELTERTITFNGNGGTTPTGETYTQTVYDGIATNLTANQFTKENSAFIGWSTTQNGDVEYADGASITVSGDITLYAQWSTAYTAMVDDAIVGGTVLINGDVIVEVAAGTVVTLTYNATPGYAFSAWNVYKADNPTEAVEVENNQFNMPEYDVIVSAKFDEVTTYSLVTNVNQIVSGKHYIIATGSINNKYYAIGGQNSSGYRNPVEVTVDNNYIAHTDGLYEFVLNVDNESGWTIYDKVTPGYFVSGNKSLTTNANNGTAFNISINDENDPKATISKNGYSIQYNSSSPRFACYSSSQKDVYLYIKLNDNDLEYYGSEITYTENTIPTGETITVGTGSVMTINNGSFTNTDPEKLVIEDGGQLIHDNAVSATIQKNVTGYSNSKDKDNNGYLLIASPVESDLNVATHTNLTEGDYDLYYFDHSYEHKEWRNYKKSDNPEPFTSIKNGIGYLYANTQDITISFSGELKPSLNVVQVDLAYVDGKPFSGWNLVGNPFACNAYIIGATEKVEAYYKMNDNGNGFVASTDAIDPMEGIFVQASATDQSFFFTRNEPSKGVSNLNLQVAQVVNNRDAQPATDNAIIRFDGGNTLEKFSFSEDNAKLYIPQNGKDYAVVSSDTQGEMPVNFKAAENGTYTIDFSMDNVEFSYLHLIDNKTGMDIDLLQTSSYTFEASKIDYASRFKLVFSTNSNSYSNDDNDFAFFDANGNLLILGNEGTATLQVIDITGRTVSNETFSGNYSKAINAKAGVYMLRLIQGNDVRTQKIVVR